MGDVISSLSQHVFWSIKNLQNDSDIRTNCRLLDTCNLLQHLEHSKFPAGTGRQPLEAFLATQVGGSIHLWCHEETILYKDFFSFLL